MTILFVTRKFPPSIGGMQKVIFELYKQLNKITKMELTAWGGSQLWLPLILPYLFLGALFKCLINPDIKIIFLGDALLAPMGGLLKLLTRKKVVVMTHGLDITWPPFIYQALMTRSLKRMDRVFCVSRNTEKECLQRKIPADIIQVIPNGVNVSADKPLNVSLSREIISSRFNINLDSQSVILSVGRMVERKGIHSFLNNIFPLILKKNPHVFYIIAGDGPFRPVIEEAINRNNLHKHVFLTGRVEEQYLKSLYEIAEVFIMPNIPVEGDVEGFGIVILEASARGLPVVASKIDGIVDAIQEGKNGHLINYNDYRKFSENVVKLVNDGRYRKQLSQASRLYIEENFTWKLIAQKYFSAFKDVVKHDH